MNPNKSALLATQVAILAAAEAMAADYQTSETHHPDHVLVPRAAFEAMRDVLAEMETPEMTQGLFEIRNGFGELISKHGTKGDAVAQAIMLKREGRELGHFVVNAKGTLVWSA